MQKREFSITILPDRVLRGDFRVPEYPEGKPLVIFCHGFKGFKDWGGWQYAMDRLCSNGFFVIAFNFSHNGIGSDLENFTELNKFAVNTISKELEDIYHLLKTVEEDDVFPEIGDKPRIGLIGHSRGGGTALLFASMDMRINAVVSWASVANFDNYLSKKEEWRTKGFLEFENARTKQMMRMNLDFLDDLEVNPIKRDICLAEKRLGHPHLIIHGDTDEAVPLDHAQKLFEVSDKTITRLEIIEGATHTFGTAHPFSGSNESFDNVINKTIEWFRTYLVNI